MKELYFTLPYRRCKKTVRLEYGQVKKKFIVRTFDGEINGKRTSEDSPKEEVFAGYEILKSLNLRQKGATLVACPSCGRADVDVVKLANDVDSIIKQSNKNIKVAVMGCEVNGPGEAKDADVGIAAGAGRAIIFRKGEKVRVVPENEMLSALMEKIDNTPIPETTN